MQYVGFTLEDDFFGAAASVVREVVRTATVISLPNTPDFVQGVIHLRADIIPVIDINKRLNIDHERAGSDNNRFLILDIQGTAAAIIVDSVTGVHTADSPQSSVEDDPENLNGRYVKGIKSVGVLKMKVLDFDKILDAEKRGRLGHLGNDDR